MQTYLGFVLAPRPIRLQHFSRAWLHFRLHLVAKSHAVYAVVYPRETACSMLWFIHVIMSVNTHLRRRIFIAVLHNAAEQIPDKLAIRPPVRDGRATPN